VDRSDDYCYTVSLNRTGKDGSGLKFVGPESALEISRQDIGRRIRRYFVDQHFVW
jgi:hypothetical protein